MTNNNNIALYKAFVFVFVFLSHKYKVLNRVVVLHTYYSQYYFSVSYQSNWLVNGLIN